MFARGAATSRARNVSIVTNASLALTLCIVMGAYAADETGAAPASPAATASVDSLVIAIPETERELILSIHYPVIREESLPDKYPLVVFFHGAFCSAAGYARLADYWANQGYVVIMPSHPDFGSQGRPDSARAHKVFLEHITEMSAILDSLDAIEQQVEPLRGLIDSSRVAAAGHSMGALIASAVSGLPRLGPDGESLDFRDDRFDVAVLLSGPGPLPNTAEDAWDSVTLPTLVTTGTQDHANRGGEGATWEWRLGIFELTPPGDKFALVVDEADHFLGGMLCPARGSGELDQEAFGIVAAASATFMDAYLKQDEIAQDSLNYENIQAVSSGRAELRSR